MDEGRMSSRQVTWEYKSKIKGHMKYLERYALHNWLYKDTLR